MRLNVKHSTRYEYGGLVTLGHNQLRLTPRTFARQTCLSSKIGITPVPATRRMWRDSFGNEVTYVTLEEPHEELTIESEAVVNVLPNSLLQLTSARSWELARDALALASPDTLDAQPFLFDSPRVDRTSEALDYATPSFPSDRPLGECLLDLTRRIHTDFSFDPRATTIHTTSSQVFRDRRGVCQDFAHLQIACLRSLGLAARYVSGYLLTRPPPGKPKLIGADASHAWVSVWVPDQGWYDLDPTNDQAAGEEYVTLGWGRDYGDVAPMRGLVLGGGASTLTVAVDVTELLA